MTTSIIEGTSHARPLTSLLIATRNRPQLLLDTVQSVLRGDALPTELIIIDQSQAPHPELSQATFTDRCEVHYHWTGAEVVGVSRARNMAAAAARHDILVFMDDDMIATERWFEVLVGGIDQADPRRMVCGQVLEGKAEVIGGFAPSISSGGQPHLYQGRVWADVLYSGNMALPRRMFAAIGGFDERLGPGTSFPAAEDNDLGYRLLEAGYAIHHCPEAILYHRAWRSGQAYQQLRWSYGLGRGAYYAKHMRLRDPYMAHRFSRDLWRQSTQGIRRLLRDPDAARGNARLALGLLVGAGRWWSRYGRSKGRAVRWKGVGSQPQRRGARDA